MIGMAATCNVVTNDVIGCYVVCDDVFGSYVISTDAIDDEQGVSHNFSQVFYIDVRHYV